MRPLVLALLALAAPLAAAQVPEAQRLEVTRAGFPGERLIDADAEEDIRLTFDGERLHLRGGQAPASWPLDGRLIHAVAAEGGDRVAALVRMSDDSVALRVYSAGGSQLREQAMAVGADDSRPEIALNGSTGNAAVALPSTAEICFLQEAQSGARCRRLFEEADHSLERNVLIRFDAVGRHVAVAAQRAAVGPALDEAQSNSHLFLFDYSGDLLWEAPLDAPSIRALAFEGDYVAVSTYDARRPAVEHRSRLFTADGAPVLEVREGAQDFLFRDGSVILVDRRRAAAYRIADGQQLGTFMAPERTQVISADEAGAEGVAVLLGRPVLGEDGFGYEGTRIVFLDSRGEARAWADVRTEFSAFARVSSDLRGRTLVVLDDATHHFGWPQ